VITNYHSWSLGSLEKSFKPNLNRSLGPIEPPISIHYPSDRQHRVLTRRFYQFGGLHCTKFHKISSIFTSFHPENRRKSLFLFHLHQNTLKLRFRKNFFGSPFHQAIRNLAVIFRQSGRHRFGKNFQPVKILHFPMQVLDLTSFELQLGRLPHRFSLQTGLGIQVNPVVRSSLQKQRKKTDLKTVI
jgi:hypothetical protein